MHVAEIFAFAMAYERTRNRIATGRRTALFAVGFEQHGNISYKHIQRHVRAHTQRCLKQLSPIWCTQQPARTERVGLNRIE